MARLFARHLGPQASVRGKRFEMPLQISGPALELALMRGRENPAVG